jgi:hypothetical protein
MGKAAEKTWKNLLLLGVASRAGGALCLGLGGITGRAVFFGFAAVGAGSHGQGDGSESEGKETVHGVREEKRKVGK